MKAVYIAEPGGPEKLIFGDRPDPHAGPGEVVVRVRASAVNHADLGIRSGRSATGSLPRILGLDMAGEIASLGPGVTGFATGDRVTVENRVKCGVCTPCVLGRDEYCERQKRLGGELDGGHAQYCAVPAANLQRIPDWMDWDEAATLPLAGHTAWHCLVERVQLQPWEDVLIHAVGSGVGSFGLSIAKGIGARAIVTAGSDWKLQKAKALGADHVINYTTTPKFSSAVKELTGGRGVDVVFDCVGAPVWDESCASLKPGGRLVITGTTAGSQIPFNLSVLQGRPLTLMGSGARSRRSFAAMLHTVHYGRLRGVGRTSTSPTPPRGSPDHGRPPFLRQARPPRPVAQSLPRESFVASDAGACYFAGWARLPRQKGRAATCVSASAFRELDSPAAGVSRSCSSPSCRSPARHSARRSARCPTQTSSSSSGRMTTTCCPWSRRSSEATFCASRKAWRPGSS